MLDGELTVKVSDFGASRASRLASGDEVQVEAFSPDTRGGRHQPRVLLSHDREIMGVHVREELGVELLDDAAELVMPCLSLTGEETQAVSEVADKIERLREAVHAEMQPCVNRLYSEHAFNPEHAFSLGVRHYTSARTADPSTGRALGLGWAGLRHLFKLKTEAKKVVLTYILHAFPISHGPCSKWIDLVWLVLPYQ
jgi:hypothetical protein